MTLSGDERKQPAGNLCRPAVGPGSNQKRPRGYRFQGASVPLDFDAATGSAMASFLKYPFTSFCSSPVSVRRFNFTAITHGRLCRSVESLGVSTPTARQIADSSRRAISTAVAFGLSRFSRTHSNRFDYSPSIMVNVS